MKNERDLKRAMKELEVKAPGSSDDIVSQNKLRQYESLQDELRALTRKFAEFRADMKDVMKGGASVSTGKRGLKSGIFFRRHPSYKAALIEAKGEAFQQEILNKSVYRPYYYVRLITTPKNGKE